MGDRPVLGKEEGTVLRSEADARALGRFIYQVHVLALLSLLLCLCGCWPGSQEEGPALHPEPDAQGPFVTSPCASFTRRSRVLRPPSPIILWALHFHA